MQAHPHPDTGKAATSVTSICRSSAPLELTTILRGALEEDLGTGDLTTEALVPVHAHGRGVFAAKEVGVLAGTAASEHVFALLEQTTSATWSVSDGENLNAGTIIGEVCGPIHALLAGERLALNVLQRMSGIASATRQMVLETKPYRARIRDTRKTAPGLRGLDKWAVRIGGGVNHRMGLYDRILIKNNHVAAVGGIDAALDAAVRATTQMETPCTIDIEAQSIGEVEEALEAGGFDVLLLDNMARISKDGSVDTTMLQDAVRLVDGRYLTEASGNVTLQSVRQIAASGVDYIACGCLTHSVKALDISMRLLPN